MASKPEVRGNSVRTTWLLGGNGPKQSVTFRGGDPKERMNLVLAAKALAEAKNHCITRDEMYAALAVHDEPEPSQVPTLAQWLPIWRQIRLDAGEVAAHTVESNIKTLRLHALPMLGHLRLTDIDRERMRAWVGWLRKRSARRGRSKRRTQDLLGGGTIRTIYQVLSVCLGAAVPAWLAANPATPVAGERKNFVGLPPVADFEGMFLEPWESDLILANCRPQLHDLVFIALRTGMRIGELMALEVRDVLFSRAGGATLQVRRTVKPDGRSIGTPKTAKSLRDVTVDGAAVAVLSRLTRGQRPHGRVFLTARGKPWFTTSLREVHWHHVVGAAMRCPRHLPPAPPVPKRGPQRRYRPDEVSTCQCEGVLRRRPRLHDLRHTHASACLESGMSPKKVQVRLGHANYQTTMRIYAHVLNSGGSEELSAIERHLTRAGAPVSRVAGGRRRRGAGLVRRGHVRRLLSAR